MKVLIGVVVGVLACTFACVVHANGYQIIQSNTQKIQGVIKTDTVVQVGGNPLNRFVMHRVRKEGKAKGVLLVLPPLGPDYDFYEFDENGDFNESFAAYFAKKDYEVYGYSTRFRALTAPLCDSNPAQCEPMKDWGIQTVIDDVAFIRQQIAQDHPGETPVIGGHSSGSMYAQAILNVAPASYRAAFFWEGTLYSARSDVRSLNQQWCDVDQGQYALGHYFDPSSQGFKALAGLALTQPNGPTPVPGFPPGTTNHQAFITVLGFPPPSPVTQFVPGYTLSAADLQTFTLDFASEFRVIKNILLFVDYTPIATIRDINCSIAGDRTFTNNLQAFTGPIYVIEGGRGFGTTTGEAASLTSSSSITTNLVTPFAHIDHWASDSHRSLVEKPLEHWLKTVVFH